MPSKLSLDFDMTQITFAIYGFLLVIAVFIEWFSLTTDPSVVQRGGDPSNWACGVGNTSCSAWDTFPILRWLLRERSTAAFEQNWADLQRWKHRPLKLVQKVEAALDLFPCDLLVIHRDAEKEPRAHERITHG